MGPGNEATHIILTPGRGTKNGLQSGWPIWILITVYQDVLKTVRVTIICVESVD